MKRFFPRHSSTTCALGFCVISVLCAPIQADTVTDARPIAPTTENATAATTIVSTPIIEPRAFDILRRADAIYKKARSFSIQVQLRLVSPESKQDDKFNFNIQAIPRQRQLRLVVKDSLGTKAVISDGQKVWRTHSRYKNEYSLQPFDSVEQMRRTTSKFESLLKDAGVEGYAMYLFFNDRTAAILLAETLQSLRVGETTTFGGVAVEPVIATISNQSQDESYVDVITFFFGRDDHLLRRTLFVSSNQDGYAEETYSNIRLNPELRESLFTFKPTKSMKRVPSVDWQRDGVSATRMPEDILNAPTLPKKKPIVKPQTAKSRRK